MQMDFMEYFKELCARLIEEEEEKIPVSAVIHKFPDELVDGTRVRP